MINYTEKYKIHEALDAAGFPISEKNGAWVSENNIQDEVINNFIAAYDSLPAAQADAITTISQHADSLIKAKINPIKQRRLSADALSASIKKGKGVSDTANQAKLDVYETAMVYPDAVFAQYDVEESAILTQTDWTQINVEAAKANLDAIV